MSASQRRGGAPSGSDKVLELCQIARKEDLAVTVKYVLVVPSVAGKATYSVAWNMAPEPSKATGDVFILFLDV